MLKKIGIFLISLWIVFFTMPVWADEYPIALESPSVSTHDVASIRRGARNFVTYCLMCHTLKYMEHDPIAKEAGITNKTMPIKNKLWFFGAVPPDLTLMARIHSKDWLYTYLHVFYQDSTRPTGFNNLLVNNINMPNPFVAIQGQQILIANKKELFSKTPLFIHKLPYYSVLELVKQGSMKSDEFDRITADLVNFLIYASDPYKITREIMGIGVLIFIALLFVFLMLLKKEYWKRVK